MDVEYVQEESEQTSSVTLQKNVFDLFGSGSEGEKIDKLKFFLPPVITDSGDVLVKNVTVSTTQTTNGPVYEYAIHWSEPTAKTQRAWEQKFALGSQISTTRKHSSIVFCDGPCKNQVPLSSVVQYGCDHVICDGCRKSQTSAPLFDGAPGCCNEGCVQIAKINGEKLRSALTRSGYSRVSMNGPWETILIHVSVLKKVYSNVVRSHFEYEFSSQSRVSSLMRTLHTYQDVFENSRVYYSLKKPETHDDLNPISILETNLRFHDLIGSEEATDLYFIVAGNGVNV